VRDELIGREERLGGLRGLDRGLARRADDRIEEVRRDTVTRSFFVREERPRRSRIQRRREVSPFRVLFALVVGRVRLPHLRYVGEARLEDAVLRAALVRKRGGAAVRVVCVDRAKALEHAALNREEVGYALPGVELPERDLRGAAPCVVRGTEPMKRVNEALASGE
jgi:hypothetical protein